ncbi:HEPN domain-containing protein [Halorussus aquaticus]|uniref:HEPN domain-containing protein n=1 Tax=Halorussus aquaticus TaxID=2953748 RepID=UPI0020B76EB8|nr:HEPN domain-containing protein [Halorussus aquaticus]
MEPKWFDEARPLVKKGVKAVIDEIKTETNIPTETFQQLSSGTLLPSTSSEQVSVPGNLLKDNDVFDNLYNGEFADAAEFIFENLQSPPEDETYSEGDRIESIERALFEFTGTVLNYEGEMQFDEATFEAAFNEQFEPRFTDRERTQFLLCLKNTNIGSDITIDLEPDLQGDPDFLGPYTIETLRIRPLDKLEETGITTFEFPQSDILDPASQLNAGQPNPALEIVLRRQRPYRCIAEEIEGNEVTPWQSPEFDLRPADFYPWQKLTALIRYIATTVRRCVRLQCPRSTVGFEKGYAVSPGWETYRGIASRVTFEIEFECPTSTTNALIAENRELEINRIWENHRNQLRPDDTEFHKPLSRFERMFSRDTQEDQLIDCVVGCETTLLTGGSPGGNQYRLGLRAASLLGESNSKGWSATKLAEFFRTMYELRSDVVHDDKELPTSPSSEEFIEVNGEKFSAQGFLTYARQLYSEVLLAYLQLVPSKYPSATEVTKKIDRFLLEQSSMVRESLLESSYTPPDE